MIGVNNNNYPLVSVIMNCYNGEKFLNRSLSSIINQTYKNIELIFFDNCSTDNSKKKFDSFKDERFKYFKSNNNVSLGNARSLAINKCQGDYVAFLDVDDEWFPYKTEIQIRRMLEDESVLSYGGVVEHFENNQNERTTLPKNKGVDSFKENLINFEIQLPTLIFKKEKLNEKKINFDPLIEASEEYCLCMQFIINERVSVINYPLARYFVRNNSLTKKFIQKWSFERRYTLNIIKDTNQYIYKKYIKQFEEAYYRADYYEARYLMSVNQKKQARLKIKKAAFCNLKYLIIYLMCFEITNIFWKKFIQIKYNR